MVLPVQYTGTGISCVKNHLNGRRTVQGAATVESSESIWDDRSTDGHTPFMCDGQAVVHRFQPVFEHPSFDDVTQSYNTEHLSIVIIAITKLQ